MNQVMLIDGKAVGVVNWARGGAAQGVVNSQFISEDAIFPTKQVSGTVLKPWVINIGMNMGRAIFDWIADSWRNGIVKKKCAIAPFDPYKLRTLAQWDLLDAYISEVTIPACDSSSAERGSFTLTIVPGDVEYVPGGADISAAISQQPVEQWFVSDFRVQIGSLPCDGVAKLEPFTWKQRLVEQSTKGSLRKATTSSVVEVPDLKLTIALFDITAWMDWLRNSLVVGSPQLLAGSLHLLRPDLRELFATISMENVGISALHLIPPEANKEEPGRFEVRLYCERMFFEGY